MSSSEFQSLFTAVGVDRKDRSAVARFARAAAITVARLRFYDDANVIPSEPDLSKICAAAGISKTELKLRTGNIDHAMIEGIREHASELAHVIEYIDSDSDVAESEMNWRGCPEPVFKTDHGVLYQEDCMEVLKSMAPESVDMVFADPPFNLKKIYPSGIDDNKREDEYIAWCERWLDECIRVLKYGGALFLWNLPRWNARLAQFLTTRMTFRHWIAVDIKYTLPIQKRLYPSHYSLLYFVKGPQPKVHHADRLPMEVCPHCTGDLRDYGGYKNKMNPKGVSLTDVWYDIPPVRHAVYKGRKDANEVSLKLLDRVIEIATDPGDIVFDPFGGAGTTYVAAELKGRQWIGVECGPIDDILGRFDRIEDERVYMQKFRSNLNSLFPSDVKAKRKARRQWTDETFQGCCEETRRMKSDGSSEQIDLIGDANE